MINIVRYNRHKCIWDELNPQSSFVVSNQGTNPIFNELSTHIRWIDQALKSTGYGYIFSMHQDFNTDIPIASLLETLPPNQSYYLIGEENDPLHRLSIICRYDNESLTTLKNYLHGILKYVLLKKPITHTVALNNTGSWKKYSVSIVVPLYNGVEYLPESIGSIIRQTYTHWEVIIGVNGHNEDSQVYKQAKTYESEQIRVILYPTKGKENTMNAMMKDIHHDIVCLLDVDDYWEPNKLIEQIHVWKYGEYDVIGTYCKYFGDIDLIPPLPQKEISRSSIFNTNPIINSSMMIKHEDALWTDRFKGLDDYDMWLRLAYNGSRFYNIPQVLTHHRIHSDSAFNTSNNSNVPNLLKHWNRQLNNLTTIVSCYYSIKSKFPSIKYIEWMNNFLSLECNLVIYTDKESESIIRSIRARKGLMDRTAIIIKPIEDWTMYPYRDAYLHSHTIDTENDIHSPELYMLWNEKTFFVNDAIKLNPFHSQWFFWSDIGCMRYKEMFKDVQGYPNPYRVLDLPSHKFILSSIIPFSKEDSMKDGYSPIPYLFRNRTVDKSCGNVVRIQGGFFGGHISQWSKWTSLFSSMFAEFVRTKTFIGKDQYIMASVFLNNPNDFHLFQATDNNIIRDPWFDFLYRLS
jgi:teichuronic acid biosynthesis glycosyltransferase TuaG